jgi:hypothetical protein
LSAVKEFESSATIVIFGGNRFDRNMNGHRSNAVEDTSVLKRRDSKITVVSGKQFVKDLD